MQLWKVTVALSVLQSVAAHSVFTTFFVNDVNQGDGTCVRMNMTPDNSTSPVNDLASNDMACGYDGTMGVARVCSVSQGSKLTFLWREWADASKPGAIDASHKGPCAVYMKAVPSAIHDPGYGTGWFKIWDSGYDSVTSQWCTEKLIQNAGLLSVDVPGDLAGGYYLVRPELLALHQADKSPPNPQFYTGCAQIFLDSGATASPADTVSIPGYVHAGDPSVDFNIYTPSWPYPMPGPAPYEGAANIHGMERDTVASQVQKEGLAPQGCVLSNANWCGLELDSYNTEAGCWNASTACFNQDTTCYASSPPTGSKNCAIWEAKCDSIQAGCNAGNYTGPPNKGKDLNPASSVSYVIPPPFTLTGDVYSTTSSEIASMSVAAEVTSVTSIFKPKYSLDTSDPDSYVKNTFASAPPTTTITDMLLTTSATPSSSTTSTTSLSASPTPTILPPPSVDATCGPESNCTCLGSVFGACCSQYNWCGISDAYCGIGCQEAYGTCGNLRTLRKKSHAEKHNWNKHGDQAGH